MVLGSILCVRFISTKLYEEPGLRGSDRINGGFNTLTGVVHMFPVFYFGCEYFFATMDGPGGFAHGSRSWNMVIPLNK